MGNVVYEMTNIEKNKFVKDLVNKHAPASVNMSSCNTAFDIAARWAGDDGKKAVEILFGDIVKAMDEAIVSSVVGWTSMGSEFH